ncbi:Beta-glucosidase BoGH3B [Linum grandiflorum]
MPLSFYGSCQNSRLSFEICKTLEVVKALAVGIFVIFVVCWLRCEAGSKVTMAVDVNVKYKDPKVPVEDRITDLLSRMTLQEKIGQMTQIEVPAATTEVMEKYFIGSLLTGGGNQPVQNNSPKYWVDMINKFQKGSMKTRLAIPMIYGIDAVHGHNNVINATIFPHNINLGVARQVDPALVKKIGGATALEVRATGIPYAFAPCVAVCRDPRWGRCYESYSEDHKIVEEMTDIVNGLQGDLPPNYPKDYPYIQGRDKVAGCAKHYIGDGGTIKGMNENNTIIDMKDLMAIHMPPYDLAIEKGVATVMISFSSINGVKMHANADLISLLKKKFKGFVISDWQAIDKITDPPGANYTYSVQASISAGLDMIMVPDDYISFIGNLTTLVNDKVIPMSRIDDAVTRILRVKFLLGLFENPYPDNTMADMLGKPEHRELAREAVRKSLVLLKNGKTEDKSILPLPKKAKKILVVGSHADNLGYQCGGWTVEWQGYSGNDRSAGTTILAGIKKTVDPTTEVMFDESANLTFLKANKDAEFVIVVVGEKPYAETKGDNLNLTIPHPSQEVIRKACSSGVKCVVILISGRPLVIEAFLPAMDALVAAFLPGSEGRGVADVLFGDYGFTGKLARTWMKRLDQLPMNFGDKNYDPLFPFGFGLQTKGEL